MWSPTRMDRFRWSRIKFFSVPAVSYPRADRICCDTRVLMETVETPLDLPLQGCVMVSLHQSLEICVHAATFAGS